MAAIGSEDPRQLRIGDAERDRVTEILRHNAAEGRIDPGELDERLEATLRSRTYADLEPIVADLPADPRLPAPPRPAPARRDAVGHPIAKSVAVGNSCRRTGRWLLPVEHRATAVFGDVVLDLREASFAAQEVTIRATAVMGDVKILIDEFTDVVLSGLPLLGDIKQLRDKVESQVSSDSQRIRIKGTAMLGDVRVQRLPQPGTRRRFFGRS